MDLIIEGHPAELEWLRREIEQDCGDDAALEAVPAHDGEELREPLIIALVVSLGGPATVRSIAGVLKRRYQHVEEMRRIANEQRLTELQHEQKMTALRLRVADEEGERQTSEEELAAMAP
ncbi:MAG TPA: hypothetical protein VF317_06610 [Dermatophilaceae bacterium]